MLNLFAFVSSFGFGHLTRTIAVIRHLLDLSKDIYIHLIGPEAHCEFFNRSIRSCNSKYVDRVRSISFQTDLGLHYDKFSIEPDIDKSITNSYDFYVKNKYEKLEKLTKIVKRFSKTVIYSDISPLAFDLANELSLPSLAVSNFDWYSVFSNLKLENSDLEEMHKEVSQSLYDSYRKSDVLIQLPLSDEKSFIPLGNKKIIYSGFFARKKTIDKAKFHSITNIPQNHKIAYVSYGMNIPLKLDKLSSKMKNNPDLSIHFLTSKINDTSGTISTIPSSETESQNWIGNCDYFIGKPGWGTLSECIVNQVKLLLVPTLVNIESQILIRETLKLGGSKILLQSDFQEMSWIDKLTIMDIPEYKDNIDKSGLNTISNHILDLL